LNTRKLASPIGLLYISEHGGFITELRFLWEGAPKPLPYPFGDNLSNNDTPQRGVMYFGESSVNALDECESQLDAYFKKELKEFCLPLKIAGTSFQLNVWKALLTVPYGQTNSYKNLAIRIGNPKAVRAVGGANNKNPISIILPCHRIIGSDGKLVGYGGGMDAKKYLLELEKSSS